MHSPIQVVSLADCDAEIFALVLEFLYANRCSLAPGDAFYQLFQQVSNPWPTLKRQIFYVACKTGAPDAQLQTPQGCICLLPPVGTCIITICAQFSVPLRRLLTSGRCVLDPGAQELLCATGSEVPQRPRLFSANSILRRTCQAAKRRGWGHIPAGNPTTRKPRPTQSSLWLAAQCWGTHI